MEYMFETTGKGVFTRRGMRGRSHLLPAQRERKWPNMYKPPSLAREKSESVRLGHGKTDVEEEKEECGRSKR